MIQDKKPSYFLSRWVGPYEKHSADEIFYIVNKDKRFNKIQMDFLTGEIEQEEFMYEYQALVEDAVSFLNEQASDLLRESGV